MQALATPTQRYRRRQQVATGFRIIGPQHLASETPHKVERFVNSVVLTRTLDQRIEDVIVVFAAHVHGVGGSERSLPYAYFTPTAKSMYPIAR